MTLKMLGYSKNISAINRSFYAGSMQTASQQRYSLKKRRKKVKAMDTELCMK